jgi:hypothetical protein
MRPKVGRQVPGRFPGAVDCPVTTFCPIGRIDARRLVAEAHARVELGVSVRSDRPQDFLGHESVDIQKEEARIVQRRDLPAHVACDIEVRAGMAGANVAGETATNPNGQAAATPNGTTQIALNKDMVNPIRFDCRARQEASAEDDLSHMADFDCRTQVAIDLHESAVLERQIASAISAHVDGSITFVERARPIVIAGLE